MRGRPTCPATRWLAVRRGSGVCHAELITRSRTLLQSGWRLAAGVSIARLWAALLRRAAALLGTRHAPGSAHAWVLSGACWAPIRLMLRV